MADSRTENLERLESIARKKTFFNPNEYTDETEEIYNEWNSLVPIAERSGISHKEMKEIWDTWDWNTWKWN